MIPSFCRNLGLVSKASCQFQGGYGRVYSRQVCSLFGRTVTGRVCQTVYPDQSFEEAIQRQCMEFLWIVQSGFAILDTLHLCTMCKEIVQSGTNTKNRSLKHIQDSSCWNAMDIDWRVEPHDCIWWSGHLCSNNLLDNPCCGVLSTKYCALHASKIKF